MTYAQPNAVEWARFTELSALASAVWSNPDRLAEVRAVLTLDEQGAFDNFIRIHTDQEYKDRLVLREFELSKIRAREEAKAAWADEQSEHLPRTWVKADHDEAFAARVERPMPLIGRMAGELEYPLVYLGKINDVHGDSEGGKSWFAQWLCVQEMMDRHMVVLYLDFEDDAGAVYNRLMLMGATEEVIRERFIYICPTTKLTAHEIEGYLSLVNIDAPHSLAVVDGVTEAMSLQGLTGRDENEVALWHAQVTKPLAAAGWGVLTIDHTPHGEDRAIGSQHKKSAITGVSYLIQSSVQFAPGQKGRSRLCIEKDRLGWLREVAQPGERPQWLGSFVLDSTVPMLGARAAIWPWRDSEERGPTIVERPSDDILLGVLAFLEINPGSSKRAIREAKIGKTDSVIWAIEWLEKRGYVRTESGAYPRVDHFKVKDWEPEAVNQDTDGSPEPRGPHQETISAGQGDA